MPDKISLRVEGIACQSCVNRIDTTLRADGRVESVEVSIPQGTVTVAGKRLDADQIRGIIEALGFDVLGIGA